MLSTRVAYAALTPEHATFPSHHEALADPVDSGYGRNESGNVVSCSLISKGHDIQTSFADLWAQVQEVLAANTGLLFITASQACLAIVNVSVKALSSIDPPVSTLELIWVRMTITYICSIIVMLTTKVPDPVWGPKGVRRLLWLRGFVGFFGLFGIYYSLEFLSLSDATVLTFLAPMCTAVAGAIFLGENFTRQQAFAGIVSFLGVVLIARPASLFGHTSSTPSNNVEKSTPAQRLAAVGVALIGVLGATGAYTTIRAIGTRAHPLHSLSFFSMQSVIVSTIGMIITKTPIVVPTKLLWLLCLSIIGILGFIGQVFLTMGLQRETAGRGTMALYTHIVFAIALEAIVFHTTPGILSIFGTLLILGSALYVAVTKRRDKQPDSVSMQELSVDAELEEGLLNDHRDDDDDHISIIITKESIHQHGSFESSPDLSLMPKSRT